MTTQTVQLKMAIATPEDFDTTYKIIHAAQTLEQNNVFSYGWDDNYVDLTDSEKRQINALANRFERHSPSLWRVIGCAQTLMSPTNGVIDPDQDVLDFSPQLKRQHELVTLVEEKDFLGQLKAPLIGEHSIDVECSCSACDFEGPDEDCEVCQGDINYIKNVTIDWTTQKEIITAALHELGFKVEKMN